MTKEVSEGLALIVASIVLINGYRLAPLLPNDWARGLLAFASTALGLACLVLGALRLYRHPK